MLFKLSNLNSNLALTLGYLNPALNNSAQMSKKENIQCNIIDKWKKKLMCINCSLTFCSHIWLSKIPQHVSFHQNLMLAHSHQNQQNDLALFSRDTHTKKNTDKHLLIWKESATQHIKLYLVTQDEEGSESWHRPALTTL